MKAKVVLAARVKDGEQFPFIPVQIVRNAIKLPVEQHIKDERGRIIKTKYYEPDAILGYFARYPHIVGACLFPGCIGKAARHVQSLGKDHIEAFAQYQRIERDFSRARDGKLPLEEVKPVTAGRSLEEAVSKFLNDKATRKARTVETYRKSLEQFMTSCAASKVRSLEQVNKETILGFVDWMKKNIKTRNGGIPQNTYRNKLKDVRVFLIDAGVGMPLKPKDWPHTVRTRKEKYSTDSVQNMLRAADRVQRHSNNSWSAEDDKDLVHFLLKSGFRDDEIAHAQYSDIKNGTVNVNPKPCDCSNCKRNGGIWTPKDSEVRETDIVVDEAFLKRMKKRQERYAAKLSDFIFPNRKGKPNNHLIRVIQRLASNAGIQGRIGLHKFRKTFGTLIAKEEGIEQARILLGHSDIATTQRYLAADEVAPEQTRKAVRRRFAAFGD